MTEKEYPAWVCEPCGVKYSRTGKFNKYATWHTDTCDICHDYTMVTEPRDFGHLRGWEKHE